LIVANSTYETPGWALTNPTIDADRVGAALADVGFDVHIVKDVDEDAMEAAFKAHGDRLAAAGPEATGFFFYAGHGVQSDGLNYLIPTDLRAYEEADVWGAPRLETLFRHLRRAGNDRNFIVLDACRNNPLQSSVYSTGGGLAGVSEEDARVRGLFIAYAAAPGQVAYEGERGESSFFSSALVDLIKEPGISVESLFRRVRTRVEIETNNKQRPWTESGLSGEADYCFAGCTPLAAFNAADPDEAFWLRITIGSNQIASCDDYRDYLEEFPDGKFAVRANRLLGTVPCVAAPEANEFAEVERDWLQATRVTRSGDNCALYTAHIEKYPDSPFRSRAEKLLGEAPCAEEVPLEVPVLSDDADTAFGSAFREDRLDLWQQFLERYPDHSQIVFVRSRIEALELEAARFAATARSDASGATGLPPSVATIPSAQQHQLAVSVRVSAGSNQRARDFERILIERLGVNSVVVDKAAHIQRDVDINTQPRFADWRIIGTDYLAVVDVQVSGDDRMTISTRVWDVSRSRIVKVNGQAGTRVSQQYPRRNNISSLFPSASQPDQINGQGISSVY
ncbi:MAG: caspase family protein, partial [Pseudomonadota bacterium]